MPTRLRRFLDRLLGRGGRLPEGAWDGQDPGLVAKLQGFVHEGRRLASWRDDLIAEGHDPAELAEPLHPADVLRSLGIAAWDRSGPSAMTRAPISETHYELRHWVQGLEKDAEGRLQPDGRWRMTGQFVIHEPGWQDPDEDDHLAAGTEITWGEPGSNLL